MNRQGLIRRLGTRSASVPVVGILTLVSAGVGAQNLVADAGAKPPVSIDARVTLTETFTDNVNLTSTGEKSEQITQISPGIRINMEGARLKGFFDYALTGFFYAQNSSSRRSESSLNTSGRLEVVDNWAFVDFSGTVSQQDISAFGKKSVDNTAINSNRAEVASYRISPYVRGRLGDLADYEARFSRTVTGSDQAAASGVATLDSLVKVSGDSSFRQLGWSAEISQNRVDFSAGRGTEVNRFSLGLMYSITPQLRVSANAGREANDYTSLDMQSFDTSGVGVSWSPSDTTTFSASRDHRSFGDAHHLSFEHRTARTVWKLSDSKDVSVTPNQAVVGGGSVYDLLFSQFASLQPDPVLRAQLVNAYLQANGIGPNAVTVNSFLTSALSLQRRQNFAFSLLGARDTFTFIATRSESTRLDTASTAVDDFTTSALIRQRGFSANLAHRLTPDYSLGLLVTQQTTLGTAGLEHTTLRLFNLNLTGNVSQRSTATLGVRRVISSGSVSYGENAVFCSLNVQL